MTDTLRYVRFIYDDGGRANAGRRGDARDCVTRAIAIATGRDYAEVYDELAHRMKERGKPKSARNGIHKQVTRQYLTDYGWLWTPTMGIGTGCQVHLRREELPKVDRMIASVSRHLVAVLGGVIYDTYDPSRDGTRCVYGYWVDGASGDAELLRKYLAGLEP
jgi:hypothetical protein